MGEYNMVSWSSKTVLRCRRARVTVSCPQAPGVEPVRRKRRVVLPLVPSKHPGTLRLTAERVAELLEEDDLSA